MSDVNVRKNQDWTEINVVLPDNEATENVKGLVRIATQDEVDQAIVDDAVITPLTTGKGVAGGVAKLDEEAKISFDNMPIVLENRAPTPEDTADVVWISFTGGGKLTDVLPTGITVTVVADTETATTYRGTLKPDNVTNSLIAWSDGQVSLSNGLVTIDKKSVTFVLTAYAVADTKVTANVSVTANPWLSNAINVIAVADTESTTTIRPTIANSNVSDTTLVLSDGQSCSSGSNVVINKQQYPHNVMITAKGNATLTTMVSIAANPWLSAYIDVIKVSETGKTITYRGVLYPDNLSNKNIIWSSGNTTVSGGTVTINKESSESTLVATAQGNNIVSITINVPAAGMGTKVPPGTILPFYNVTISNRRPIFWGETEADNGWLICDGGSDLSGGTVPNLSNRFIMGVTIVSSAKQTGGASSVKLTTANMPSHNHSVSVSGSTNSAGYHAHSYTDTFHSEVAAHSRGVPYKGNPLNLGSNGDTDTDNVGFYKTDTTAYNGSHGHTLSLSGSAGYTGSGVAHENMPPYYTLIYCVKMR